MSMVVYRKEYNQYIQYVPDTLNTQRLIHFIDAVLITRGRQSNAMSPRSQQGEL